jgi:hypothetical protein
MSRLTIVVLAGVIVFVVAAWSRAGMAGGQDRPAQHGTAKQAAHAMGGHHGAHAHDAPDPHMKMTPPRPQTDADRAGPTRSSRRCAAQSNPIAMRIARRRTGTGRFSRIWSYRNITSLTGPAVSSAPSPSTPPDRCRCSMPSGTDDTSCAARCTRRLRARPRRTWTRGCRSVSDNGTRTSISVSHSRAIGLAQTGRASGSGGRS